MVLLNSAISNLLGGVSQQADSLRGVSSCEVQTNAYPSPVSGLVKRPPTQFMTDAMGDYFTGDKTTNAATHVINRDSTERYLVVISDNDVSSDEDVAPLAVWDLVNNVSVPVFFDLRVHTYLNAGSAGSSFAFATAGDVTFICNKSRPIRAETDLTDVQDGLGLVHVRQGAYDTKYNITIDGTTVTHETHKTAENAAQTTSIAESLLTLLNGGPPLVATDSTIALGTGGDIKAGTARTTWPDYGLYAFRVTTTIASLASVGKIVTFTGTSDSALSYKTVNALYVEDYRIRTGDRFKIAAVGSGWVELETLAGLPMYFHPTQLGGSGNQTLAMDYTSTTFWDGFSFARDGSTITISKDDGTDFTLETSDDVGDTYIKAFRGSTQYFADLPTNCIKDFRIAITGHAEADIDDYYVKFVTNSGDSYGEGSWVEDVGYGISTGLRASTMPRILIRQEDGTFFFKMADGVTLPPYTSAGLPFMTDDETDDEGTIGGYGWFTYGIGQSKIAVENLNPGSVVPIGTTVAITDSDGYKREYTTAGGQTVSGAGTQTLILTTDDDITVNEGDLVELYYLGASAPTRYDSYGYQSRRAGDDTTNPMPAFVDEYPNDVFFYENRLGILAGETVTFTEAGEFFNFFRTTVIDLLDTAPIEVTGASTGVNTLRHALPFKGNLLLFGDNTQFMLGSGNAGLTPRSVSMSQVSNYECDPDCSPQIGGSSVFFSYRRGSYGGVQELVIQDPEVRSVAAYDLTDSIPSYIENPVRHLVSMPQENLVVGLPIKASGTTAMKDLYLYKYLDRGDERVQSAWFKFSLPFFGVDGTDTQQIMGIHAIENTLYVVSRFMDDDTGANSLTSLHKIEFSTEGLTDLFSLPPLIDNCVSYLGTKETATGDDDVQAVFSGGSTTFTLPYGSEGKDETDFKIISKFQTGDDGGVELAITGGNFRTDYTTLIVAGDHTGDHVWIGNTYTMTYQYASPIFKGPSAGGGSSLVTSGRYQIHSADIVFHETHAFDVAVVVDGRGSYSYDYAADTSQVNVTTEGGQGFGDGHLRIPIHAKNDTYSLTITSDSSYPVKLLSTEFEAQYTNRSRRVGI